MAARTTRLPRLGQADVRGDRVGIRAGTRSDVPRPFTVIVADPPWRFRDKLRMGKTRRGSDDQYATLSARELCALRVKDVADDDAVLALWTPGALLEQGLQVMKAWGFAQKQVWVWAKTTRRQKLHFGMGSTFRSACEVALIGTRGSPKVRSRSERNMYCGLATRHSAKPEALQEALERMLRGPKLELFARRRRPNWECTGLELDGIDVRRRLDLTISHFFDPEVKS